MRMTEAVGIVVFCWLAAWAYWALKRLASGSSDSAILFVVPIHFILCGVPLALDVLFGRAEFPRFPGFAMSSNSEGVRMIYCMYVAACPVIWWACAGRFLRKNASVRNEQRPSQLAHRKGVQLFLVLLLLSPAILVMMSPDPTMYLAYTPHQRDWVLRDNERVYHAVVVKAVQFSILASAMLIYFAKYPFGRLAWLAPLIFGSCWIHGKRNIVAFALFLVIYALWRRGALKNKRFFIAGAAAAVIFLSFSVFYQANLRSSIQGFEARPFTYWLEGIRVDFGRDSMIRASLFSQMHPEKLQILEYPGQSLAFVATMWIPRRIWPDKPAPYAQYMMEAALGHPSPGGGTMTTSVLDEAVANFGWFGILLGPMVISCVCRICDSCQDEVIYLLTLFIAIGLLTVSLSFWAHFALIWMMVVVYKKFQQGQELKLRIQHGSRLRRNLPLPQPQSRAPGSRKVAVDARIRL